MNNKLLATLWIIITAGSVFILSNLTKPESGEELLTEYKNNEQVEIIENQPANYSEYIITGNKFMEQGNFLKAIENFQKAVSINNSSVEPLIKLTQAYLKNNQPKEAQSSISSAQSIRKNDLTVQLLLAQSYLDQRNFPAAKSLIDQLDQNNQEVIYYKGLLQILNQKFKEAKETLSPLQKPEAENFRNAYQKFEYFKEGETLHLQVLLAKALTEVGQYQASIPLLFDVINKKKNYLDAWIVLGYAYLNINQSLDAIDALTNAKDLNPEKPETLFLLGLAHFSNNDIEKAIFYLEKSDESGYEPKEQIDLKLADLYLLQEKFEESEKKFTEVLSKNTTHLDIFTRVVWLNVDKLNNPEKALNIAQAALTNHPDTAMSYNLVGWALTANGNYSEAKTYLDKAINIEPTLDAAHLNMGWLYELKGQENKAKEYYKQAYNLGTGNSITNLAAQRFNSIAQKEVGTYYKQVNISSPSL